MYRAQCPLTRGVQIILPPEGWGGSALASRRQVPDADGAVLAGGQALLAVGRERDRDHGPGMALIPLFVALVHVANPAGAEVPQADRAVSATRECEQAVGGYGDTIDRTVVTIQRGRVVLLLAKV